MVGFVDSNIIAVLICIVILAVLAWSALWLLPNQSLDTQIFTRAGATYIQLDGFPVRKVLDHEATKSEVEALRKEIQKTVIDGCKKVAKK
jgi:hypothetical protein